MAREEVDEVGRRETPAAGEQPLVQDHTITLHGLRFHYRDWGDVAAPPLVLLHAY